MPKKMHPVAEQLLGLGMKALDAGLRAAADSLLEAGQGVVEDVTVRVKNGRSKMRRDPTVEGVVEGEPKKKPRRKR